MNIQDRFESKYEPVTETGCWIWTSKLNDKGYGKLSRGARGAGWAYAHRVAYEKYIGPIPAGLHVLHRCDVPCCVNPSHLSLGTQADNNADRDAKGRQVAPRGEANGMAVLNDDLVREIRKSDLSSIKLGAKLGICHTTVCRIRRREAWRHVV